MLVHGAGLSLAAECAGGADRAVRAQAPPPG